MRWLAILGVWAYRLFVRPFMRKECLHDESCSAYAIRELRERGVWRAVPDIRARVRGCRVPVGACFVIGADGRLQPLGVPTAVPPRAVELLNADARRIDAGRAIPWPIEEQR